MGRGPQKSTPEDEKSPRSTTGRRTTRPRRSRGRNGEPAARRVVRPPKPQEAQGEAVGQEPPQTEPASVTERPRPKADNAGPRPPRREERPKPSPQAQAISTPPEQNRSLLSRTRTSAPGRAPGSDDDGSARRLGEALRRAREAKGLTLEQIWQETRIRVTHLKALEAGDMAALPGPTFVMGFLRLYARQLDLPEKNLVQQFINETQQHNQELNTPFFPAPSMSRHLPGRWMVILGVVGFLGFFLFYELVLTERSMSSFVQELFQSDPESEETTPEATPLEEASATDEADQAAEGHSSGYVSILAPQPQAAATSDDGDGADHSAKPDNRVGPKPSCRWSARPSSPLPCKQWICPPLRIPSRRPRISSSWWPNGRSGSRYATNVIRSSR